MYGDDCWIGSSPLLGGTGDGGEFITLMADRLIESRTYKEIIIVSMGIAGSTVDRWAMGADLNTMMLKNLTSILRRYSLTDIIYYQRVNLIFLQTQVNNNIT